MNKKDNLQYEFLPAALEITETPPSPLGRLVIWMIFLILIASILWAYLGRVDEVAVARGKIIPDGRVKVIQPLVEGVITAIHFSEGNRVKEGQPLIELDSTLRKVDVETLEKAIETAVLERDLMKKFLEGEDGIELTSKVNLPDEIKDSLLKLVQARDSEYELKKQSLSSVAAESMDKLKDEEGELKSQESSIAELTEKVKVLKALKEAAGPEAIKLAELEKSLEALKAEEEELRRKYENGVATKEEWLAKTNELELAQNEYDGQKIKATQEKNTLEYNWKSANDELSMAQRELKSQRIRVEQAQKSLVEAEANLDSLERQKNTSVLSQIVEQEKRIIELEGELSKAKKGILFQTLTSPVDGTVQGLASNTVGGVVTPAQPIMTIVPEGTPLIIEANLLNKDVGFVAVGQEAAIKIDTFPFQKYGTLKGRVESISPDAFEDEKLGSVYKMKVSIEKPVLIVEGKEVHLSPGMAVSAEIKTGKRRIIEFFLEPLIKYTEESLKLR